MADQEQQTDQKPKRSWRAWLWLLFRRFTVGFILFTFLVLLLFQIPAVQTWAARQATNVLSRELNTEVQIDRISLLFLDKLALHQFYLEDFSGDTLLYSRSLKVDLNLNPVSWWRYGLVINEVDLEEAQLNWVRKAGQSRSDFETILHTLFPAREAARKKKPFHLRMDRLYLRDVDFRKEDQVKGNRLRIALSRGQVVMDTFDLAAKTFVATAIHLDRPIVEVVSFPPQPLDSLQVSAFSGPDPPAAVQDSSGLLAAVHRLTLSGGTFRLHNYRQDSVRITPDSILDYRHMEVFDIQAGVDDFRLSGDTFTGRIDAIKFYDSSGFRLDRLAAEEVTVSPREVTLRGMLIETPQSRIGNFFQMRYQAYEDFADFVNRVRLEGDLRGAYVALSDVMTFAPGLERNRFFADNRNEVIQLTGRVTGTVNSLRVRDLDAKLADGSIVRGRFSSNDLTVKNAARVNVRLTELRTRMGTLRQLFPNLNFPSNFDRLGALFFKGSYDGFFDDFVANGDLETEIGSATLDMRMNLVPGREQAEYSGDLELLDFDLGVWSGDPDLGKVTAGSRVIDGVGLTPQSARAELIAEIYSFVYRDYEYRNARMIGLLNKNRFDGDFQIQDENIDFEFLGEVNLSEGVPVFDFEAVIRKMDLQRLNLTAKPYILRGDIKLDIIEDNLSDMQGTIALRDFDLQVDTSEHLVIDSLFLHSYLAPDSSKVYRLDGNLLSGQVQGHFDVEKVPALVSRVLYDNLPQIAQRLRIKPDSTPLADQSFNFELEVPNSGGFERLLSPQLGPLDKTRLQGYFFSRHDSMLVDLSLPLLQLNQFEIHDGVVILDMVGEEGSLDVVVDSIQVTRGLTLGRTVLLSFIDRDTFLFGFNSEQIDEENQLFDDLNLNGSFYLIDSAGFQIEFDDSDVVLLRDKWKIDRDNFFRFGKGFVETKNFFMTNGRQSLELENLGSRGLALNVLNLDLDLIDRLWEFDLLDFEGEYQLRAQVADVFELRDFRADLEVPNFILNENSRGQLRLVATAENLKSRLEAELVLEKPGEKLELQALYNLADQDASPQAPLREQKGYLDARLKGENYPVAVGGYFAASILEDVTGRFNAEARLWGMPERPNISGEVELLDAALTVSYLQTRYRIERGATFRIDNRRIDGTGTRLYDIFGHEAVLTGGFLHDHLKAFQLDAIIDLDQVQAMNTTRVDNSLFYGLAYGTGTVRFSGPFAQPDLYVNAVVGDSTHFIIPIGGSSEESRMDFVQFIDLDKEAPNDTIAQYLELKGLNIDMDLQIQEEAIVEIVFDEQTGDILRGQGRGNLQITVSRDGEFQMYGDYGLTEGEYLFTLYNVVNKRFLLKGGSSIEWTGDPFNARLNVRAEYRALSTSVANFIQEYLQSANPTLKNDASKSTRVNLEMKLTGRLEQPLISFDIFFPDLTGELANLTDSKMRVLRRDQNELNRQVFGLIVAGQFLPNNSAFQGTEIFYNTVSEFLSNQLSMLLTGLFSEIISDGSVLSGIDIDVAYSNYQAADLGEGQDYTTGSEFQVRLRQDFFNDRLSVIVGGNIDVGGNITAPDAANGTFVGNDLVIEYVLNKDRSLKLRVYQRLQPDLGGGRRLQVGTGLSYRREFDDFGEFLRSFRNIGKRKNKKEKGKKKQEEAEAQQEEGSPSTVETSDN